MTQLQNATIVLTGAAGGFGEQFIRQLLKAGSQLILTDFDVELLREKVATIQQEVTTGKVIACWGIDLANRDGCQRLYDQIKALQLPVDILINNAGMGLYGRMDEVPHEKWETLMEVNLITPMRLSSLFMADMIARQQGHIVNISSIAGEIVPPGLTHYGASKFGLRGFTEGLFHEVKPYNVKVTGVYPFFSRTPLLKSQQYGTLANNDYGYLENIATDPAKVIEITIRGIVNNQRHIFPDRTAKLLHLLKQYFPSLVNWRTEKFRPKT